MQKHLNQVKHNEDFHITLCSQNIDRFFDWKITCLFYVAIHCLKALAAKNGKAIGQTHIEIKESVSPQENATEMPISQKAWANYSTIYRYSRTARYNGFTDDEAMFEQTKKNDYNHALQCLNGFKGFIKGQGVPIPEI